MKDNKSCYEILLNYNCNASCIFCSQGSFDKSLNSTFVHIVREIYKARKNGYKRLGLSGGEPTIRKDLIKIIKFAKKAGFDFIRIQTNGIKLADFSFCKELVKAGLTFCKFSFTSDNPDIHDKLVGINGAWNKAITGLENLRSLKIRLGNNILINKLNYKNLNRIIKFFMDKGITNFVIIYPLYIGAMAKNKKLGGISLKDSAPYFIEAIEMMKRYGMDDEILFLNVPPCILKGYEQNVIGLGLFNTKVSDPTGMVIDLDDNSDSNKVYGEICKKCNLKGKCKGVDKNYIENWGWEGFEPITKNFSKKSISAITHNYLTDNEKCFLEILSIKNEISTSEVLKLAKKIPICQDCVDGNAVINAGNKLIKIGLIEKKNINGIYYWKLKK